MVISGITSRTRFRFVVLVLLLFSGNLLSQQPQPTPPSGAAGTGTQAPTGQNQQTGNQNAGSSSADVCKSLDLSLASAYCLDKNSSVKKCELGDTLHVGFTNLKQWMDCDPAKHNPKDLVLVLNDRVMKGLNARGPTTDYKELEFDLNRTDDKDNRSAWSALLSRAKAEQALEVAVAQFGNPPYYGKATATCQVFPGYWPVVVIFLVGLLIAFLLLAHKSDILRDAPSPPGGPRFSYSLSRCQMAWWFFIIVASFHYIWMVTGDRDSVTPGALILMGISAATGLGAVVVDANKTDQRKSLENERTALTARLAQLATAVAAVPVPANLAELQAEQQQKTARLAEVNTELSKLPSPPAPSEGFIFDILRDETGVSFHRFQMAAWTAVLGFVFVISVYQGLAMPDFNATLLGLMGISNGTYIGFKMPAANK